MLRVTYTYSFSELNGKPKRFIESKSECNIKGYGVSMDTVTLCVLYQSTESFNTINKLFYDKFKITPVNIKAI